LDVERLRAELEQQLQMWNHPAATPDASWEEVTLLILFYPSAGVSFICNPHSVK